MKKMVFFLFVFFSCLLGTAQKIELSGTYQGKNIYIQNPFAGDGKSFCTEKVLINGKEIYFANSNAYEIKLDSLGYKIGDTITVKIFHKPDCKPKVISDHSSRKSTYEVVNISVDSNAVLHFITKGEIGKLPFVIEQFKWNKWVKVGEVDAKGGVQENEYSFQTLPHSGKNQFRVKQDDGAHSCRLSTADYYSKLKKITYQHGHISTEVVFSEETMYEVFDQEGNLLMKGTGKIIDCRKLPKGAYYLNYDNTLGEFIKS